MAQKISVGKLLKKRLIEASVQTFFSVPGDFTMPLMDEIMGDNEIQLIGCCNELNAGYAADGYARNSGQLGVVVVTYMVGALSAINAIAGGYSDDVPMLIVVGGPNTNDGPERRLVHHTLGDKDLTHCSKTFCEVTAKVVIMRNVGEAQLCIDTAISIAMRESKPVYLEIPCNLENVQVTEPPALANFAAFHSLVSDHRSLDEAVRRVLDRVAGARNVVLIGGVKVAHFRCGEDFKKLAQALQCAVAIFPDAKGTFDETHNQFVGTYWGEVSTPPYMQTFIEQCDLKIFLGCNFSDYTTVGWTVPYLDERSLIIAPDHIHVNGLRYSCVDMRDAIMALIGNVLAKKESLELFQRVKEAEEPKLSKNLSTRDNSLTVVELEQSLQNTLPSDYYGLMTETGDSWFITQKLKLGSGMKYFMQMQYGSIGWALPAAVGAGIANKLDPKGRLLAVIGDGSLQVCVQELSTAMRHNVDVTVVLINNGIYTIEEQIHDGPYNDLVNWDYVAIVNSMKRREDTSSKAICVRTKEELDSALAEASSHSGFFLIECCIGRDDCTKELRTWGAKVAAATKRM